MVLLFFLSIFKKWEKMTPLSFHSINNLISYSNRISKQLKDHPSLSFISRVALYSLIPLSSFALYFMYRRYVSRQTTSISNVNETYGSLNQERIIHAQNLNPINNSGSPQPSSSQPQFVFHQVVGSSVSVVEKSSSSSQSLDLVVPTEFHFDLSSIPLTVFINDAEGLKNRLENQQPLNRPIVFSISISNKEINEKSLFSRICEFGDEQLFDAIMEKNENESEKIDINKEMCPLYQKPLARACRNGHLGIVQRLIDKNVEVDQGILRILCTKTIPDEDSSIEIKKMNIIQFLATKKKIQNLNFKDLNGNVPLAHAIKSNYLEIVKYLIQMNANILQLDEHDESLLLKACESGFLEIVKCLVEAGAIRIINQFNFLGDTPLIKAAKESYSSIVEYLIASGADVGVRNHQGRTAFVEALIRGDKDTIQVFTEKEITVETRDEDDWTPLMRACENNSIEEYKALIKKGANIDVEDKNGWTPFTIALKNQSNEIIADLKNKIKIDESKEEKSRFSIRAIERKNKEIITLLLNENLFDVNAINNQKRSCLMIAARMNDLEIVDKLIVNEAEMNAVDVNGMTAYDLALSCGYEEMIEKLKNMGAKKNQHVPYLTLLAMEEDLSKISEEVPKCSLETICELNSKGQTALMVAIQQLNDENIAGALFTSIQDPNIKQALLKKKDRNGMTAVKLASYSGMGNLLLCLGLPMKKSSPRLLIMAVLRNDIPTVRQLIEENNGIINETDDDLSRTPLMFALEEANVEIAEILINAGAELSCQDKRGWTPLLIALYKELDICQLLKNKGAVFNPQDNEKRTPFDRAIETGNDKLLTFLIEYSSVISVEKKSKLPKTKNMDVMFDLQNEYLRAADILSETADILINQANRSYQKEGLVLAIPSDHSNEELLKPLVTSFCEKLNDICESFKETKESTQEVDDDRKLILFNSAIDANKEIAGHLSESIEKIVSESKSANYNQTDFKLLVKEINETIRIKIYETITNLIQISNLRAIKKEEKNLKNCYKSDRWHVKMEDSVGYTPLMNAIKYDNLTIFKLLIEKGADTDGFSRAHPIPRVILLACQLERCEMIDELFKQTSVIRGLSPDSASLLKHKIYKILELICLFDDIKKAEIFQKIWDRYNEINEEEKINVDYQFCWGETLLMKAANNNHRFICEFLIFRGADVNKREKDGRTALIIASETGYVDMCKFLVENGASVFIKDEEGKTARQRAEESKEIEGRSEEIVVDEYKTQNFSAVIQYLEEVEERKPLISEQPIEALSTSSSSSNA